MNNHRKTAIWIGILFIIGTAAGILSLFFLGQFFDAQEILPEIAGNQNDVVIGSILILIMGFALAMIPVLLYPIFKKTHPVLALGAILFRGTLEAVVYMSQALLSLLLIPLSQQYLAADVTGRSIINQLGMFLIGADTMFAHVLSLVFSLGALMIYFILYQTRLIPRWLSIWGLVGGVLYFISPLVGFFGIEAGFLMLPLAVQEMVLAIWLIVKGFNSETLES